MMMRMTTVTIMMLTAVDCGLDIKEFNFILHIEQSMQSSMSILCVYVNRYTYTFICVHIHIHLKCHVIPATCVCVYSAEKRLLQEKVKRFPTSPTRPPIFSLSHSLFPFLFPASFSPSSLFPSTVFGTILLRKFPLAQPGPVRGAGLQDRKKILFRCFFFNKRFAVTAATLETTKVY